MKRVLVFDSGVGGLSVLDAIVASGHALELDYVADNAWLPYGLKSDEDLRIAHGRFLYFSPDEVEPCEAGAEGSA